MINFPESIPTSCSIGPIYRELLYKIVMLNLHKNILEIGCFQGYSTSAFTQALIDKADFSLSLCDVNFTPSVIRLVSNLPVKLYQQQSKNVINSSYDLIFVDGDHTVQTVGDEIKALIANRTKTVIFHDTCLMREICFWGAPLAKAIFDVHPCYYGVTLHNSVEGLLNLGFSIYSRDKTIYETILQLAQQNAEGRQLTYNIYPNSQNAGKSDWSEVKHDRGSWEHEPKFGIQTKLKTKLI